MTIETKRRLVSLIASGKNTPAEVLAALLDEDELNYAIKSNYEPDHLLNEIDGVLSLTDAGNDLLQEYIEHLARIERERRQDIVSYICLALTAIAAICSLIGLLRG